MKRLIEKFVEIGSVGNVKYTGRPRTSRSNVNIEAVRESVDENPGTSLDIGSSSWIKIANFKKLSTAYTHERSVSSCLQNSNNTTTEA